MIIDATDLLKDLEEEHCDFCESCNEWIISEKKIDIILDTILKKYGGEDE